MRDDDKLLNLPDAEFGSGVIGVCDICGTRQAVIVLQKERYKLCVIDFLNKTWIKSDRLPGAPLPPYRSDRIWFETDAIASRRAPAITLVPTKPVRHPVVLICPDTFGLTTTLLDAGIRFAREGFEVLIPDVTKTPGIGLGHHAALRRSLLMRGGVALESKPVQQLIRLYQDAFDYLRARDMVDPAKGALFGASFGGSLALAVASQDQKLAALALAYPAPMHPDGVAQLVSAPMLYVGGSSDRRAEKARAQIEAARSAPNASITVITYPGTGRDFLARDMKAYDLATAERAWTEILAFLRQRLSPPPPRPPAPPIRTAPPAVSPTVPASRPPAPLPPAPPAPAAGRASLP